MPVDLSKYATPTEAAGMRSSESDESTWTKVCRELYVVGGGTLEGLANGVDHAQKHPVQFAGNLAASVGMVVALKGPGRFRAPAAAIGSLGSLGFASQVATCLQDTLPVIGDTWNSQENLYQNKAIVEQRLGPLAFDSAAMLITGYGAHRIGEASRIRAMMPNIPAAQVEGLTSPQSLTFGEASLFARAQKSVVRLEARMAVSLEGGGTTAPHATGFNTNYGTGFLATRDGKVVSSLHTVLMPERLVAADGSSWLPRPKPASEVTLLPGQMQAESISIFHANGKEYPARVVNVDVLNDLVVLQIDRKPWQRFQPLALETTKLPAENSALLGLGFPMLRTSLHASPGTFYKTAASESLRTTEFTGIGFHSGTQKHIMALATACGQSGGPILNRQGRVIGVFTQQATIDGDPRAFGCNTRAQEVESLLKLSNNVRTDSSR